jgi:hypothetical protein
MGKRNVGKTSIGHCKLVRRFEVDIRLRIVKNVVEFDSTFDPVKHYS